MDDEIVARALEILYRKGEVRGSDLARWLGYSPHNRENMLAALERAGVLLAENDEGKISVARVIPTEPHHEVVR